MNIYVYTLFIILFSFNEASIKSDDVRNYLGSRTPYRFRCNRNDTKIKYPSCNDSQIWMIVRHGTRLPSDADIVGMDTILRKLKFDILLQHQSGKGELSEEQLSRFKEWSPDMDIDHNKFLTLEGEEEMFFLAKRMQKRFPGAIKHKYNNGSFLFKYTATQRAQESARHFANGLFSKKDVQDVIFAPAAKIEPVIRFYKHCDKWQKQVKKNPSTYKEQKLFAVSKEMNSTVESVSKRLGFDNILGLAGSRRWPRQRNRTFFDGQLTLKSAPIKFDLCLTVALGRTLMFNLDKVNLMYKICGFEISWYKHVDSPWCYAFDWKDAEVMEYYHDLKLYWLDGYGFELTYRQACLAIKNMFQTFKYKNGPNATFMFAHSGTILKILSHLGLYRPKSPLTGEALIRDRAWKSSVIDCFAANLAFVLYKCKDGDHVLALHQEHIIKLPMCEKELCPMKHLIEYFHDSIYNCDYNDMCSLETNKSTKDEF